MQEMINERDECVENNKMEEAYEKLKQIERLRFEEKGKDRKGSHANGACASKGAVKRRRRAKMKEQGGYSKHWPCGKSTTNIGAAQCSRKVQARG